MIKKNIRSLIKNSDRRVIARAKALNDGFFDLELSDIKCLTADNLRDKLDRIPHLGTVSRDRLVEFISECLQDADHDL